MKKLLTLILVLGFGTMASAGISLVVVAPDTVGIECDNDMPWSAVIGWSSHLEVITDGFTPQGMGGLTQSTEYGIFNGADIGLPQLGSAFLKQLAPAGTPTDMTEPGIQYKVQFAGVKLGYEDMGLGKVVLISEDLSTILQAVYVIPEPATMLLLGLGGLFLRRK